MDKIASSIIAEMLYKEAGPRERLIESGIGMLGGAGIGAFANKDDRVKGALTGGLIGGIAAPGLNHLVGKDTAKREELFNGKIKQKAQESYDRLGTKHELKENWQDLPSKEQWEDMPIDQVIAKKRAEAKASMLRFNEATHAGASAHSLFPNEESHHDNMFMNRRSNGSMKASMEDSAWRIFPTKTSAKEHAQEWKGIHDHLNNMTDRDRFHDLKSEMREVRTLRKQQDADGKFFKNVANYHQLGEVKKLQKLHAQKGRRDEIYDEFLRDGAPQTTSKAEDRSGQIFGNIRNLRNDANMVRNKEIQWHEMAEETSHIFQEPKTNHSFNEDYQGIKREMKPEAKAKAEAVYNQDKQYAKGQHDRWQGRAEAGYDYESNYKKMSGIDPHETLQRHGVNADDIKTKRDVDLLRRRFAKQYHPDINHAPDAAEKMKTVNADLDNLKATPWYDKLAFLFRCEEMIKTANNRNANLANLIRDDITGEYDAINQYEDHAQEFDEDSKVKEILLDIAKEEKVHVGELQKVLDLLSPEDNNLANDGKREAESAMNKKASELISELYKQASPISAIKAYGGLMTGSAKKKAGAAFAKANEEKIIAGKTLQKAKENFAPNSGVVGAASADFKNAHNEFASAQKTLGQIRKQTAIARGATVGGIGALTAGTAYASKQRTRLENDGL